MEALVNRADIALYRAKGAGRGHAVFYELEMDEALAEKRRLKKKLRTALVKGELFLQYQAVFDTETEIVTSFEALMRWENPKRGLISPTEFIPIAEDAGLIVELSHWGLMEACKQAKEWPDQIGVSFNLSPLLFAGDEVPKLVSDVLEKSGLDPARLEIEITENLFIENTDIVVRQLQEIKNTGVLVSIDNFGAGYSSFSYLKRFPFDKLKVDRSFVSDLTTDKVSKGILSAIVEIGKTLELQIVVEGVDTHEQREIVEKISCTWMQGALFSKPISATNVAGYLLSVEAERLKKSNTPDFGLQRAGV